MKSLKTTVSISIMLALVAVVSVAYAATSPGLGMANTFGILASTYTNTTGGTTINGDVGYTTGPATAPTVNGTTHSADATYAQAGIDQGTALAALNSQPCTFTFAPGAIDLAGDTTHGPVGVYTPGVYCIDGAASIAGGGTITLDGAGTYIFRMDGALTTSANSVVVLTGSASPCDVWWTPTAATTLGADSTFIGTDISPAGITIGSTVTWTGKALAFGGTVTTDSDTINVPSGCAATGTSTPPTTGDGTPAAVPGLPNTGFGATSSYVGLGGGMAVIAAIAVLFIIRKKRASL